MEREKKKRTGKNQTHTKTHQQRRRQADRQTPVMKTGVKTPYQLEVISEYKRPEKNMWNERY